MLTHDELVIIGAHWLHAKMRCSLVLMEPTCIYNHEQPDVFAIKGINILSIEAKASKSDFLREKKKTWRRRKYIQRMSNYAWFIFDESLGVDLKKVPKNEGVLLVKRTAKRTTIRQARKPTYIAETNMSGVLNLMVSQYKQVAMFGRCGNYYNYDVLDLEQRALEKFARDSNRDWIQRKAKKIF